MQSRSNKNIKGIDISQWQKGINLKSLKDKGFKICIIKATEGVNYIDPVLNDNYNKALEAKMDIGFYHFMSDKTDPVQQARDFWNAIKNKKFNIIPVLDIEKETRGRNRTEVTDRCLEFLREFKKLSGIDCVIYTYTNFAQTKLDNRLSKYRLWIAHYGVNTPGNNGIWNEWVGFQYSDKGTSNINSSLDLDEFTQEIYLNSNYKPSKPSSSTNNNSSSSGKWAVCTGDNVRVRDKASLDSNIIGHLNKGDKVKLDTKVGDWWSTYFGEHGGFVSAKYLKVEDSTNSNYNLIEQHGTCTIVVDKLNIREKPSTSSAIVGHYNKGETVQYDYYVDSEGYRWISWIGASGKRRYMAVRVLSTNKRYGHCV